MRPIIVLAALSVAACATAPTNDSSATIVVLNKSAKSASVIDPVSGRTLATLPVGRGPHELAVSRDGRTAYVANFGRFGVYPAGDTMHTVGGNTITVLDLAAGTPRTTFDLGTRTGLHGAAISRDGTKLWITSETPNALLELDAASGRVLQTWLTNQQRSHLVLPSPDERTFYVTNTVSGSVSIIDRASGQVRSIAIGNGAEGLTVSPDGGELWIARRGDNVVTIISTASGAIIDSLKVTGDGPQRIQFTPDGREVWTSNVRSNTLSVIDATSRQVVATVTVGKGPAGIVFSPDGRRGYFALSGDNAIAVIDVAKRAMIGTLATGVEPDGIAWVVAR
jgi:YVTN family beta-propeller protein